MDVNVFTEVRFTNTLALTIYNDIIILISRLVNWIGTKIIIISWWIPSFATELFRTSDTTETINIVLFTTYDGFTL